MTSRGKLFRVAGMFVLAALALVFAFRVVRGPDDASRWAALDGERNRIIFNQRLPAIQSYVQRLLDVDLKTLTELQGPNLLDNRKSVQILPVYRGQKAGHARFWFYYRAWEKDPHSAELDMALEPWILDKANHPEFRLLVEQTQKAGVLKSRLGDTEWVGQFQEDGNLHLLLRIAFPANWMEDTPALDYGAEDDFRFKTLPRILKFLRRNVLSEEWVVFAAELPYHHPNGNASDSFAQVSGYLRMGKDTLVPVDFSIQPDRSPAVYEMTVPGNFEPATKGPVDEALRKLFRSGVFSKSEKDGSWSRDGMTIVVPSRLESGAVRITWTTGFDFEHAKPNL